MQGKGIPMFTLLSVLGLLGSIAAFVVFSVGQIKEWQRLLSKHGEMARCIISSQLCGSTHGADSLRDYGSGLNHVVL
jgi:hypothetical protein